MAWQLLAAALPAAAKTVGTALQKPDQDDYKPQTDYMKKYLSYLRGRQANKEVMHLAMQPQLRAVGQQGRQMQRQVGYDVAKTGLTGSGIEAQMRLSAGQKTQQALSTATEKAVAAQAAETARLGEKAADVEARIGAEEQRSEQAFKTATSQWKKQLAGDIIGLGASVASAGIQQGVANKGAYQEAVATGQFEGSYDDFKTAAETGELPSLTGEGVDTVGRVSPSEYVQLRGARQQVIDQMEFSETVLGENVVKEYLGKGWSRQQIYKEASDQRDFQRIVKNKIGADATLEEINTAVSQINAAGGAGTVLYSDGTDISYSKAIYATDITIGEDAQTKIDFETANEIHFDADNAEIAKIDATGLTLSAGENLYLGDGSSVNISAPLLAGTDHTMSGITAQMLAGGAINAYDLVCIHTTTGEIVQADASAVATARAIGISPAAISDTATGTVLLHGFIRDDSWNWTTGSVLYLSETTGAMTHTAPTTDGAFVQAVGIALEPDVVFINPSLDIIEHA